MSRVASVWLGWLVSGGNRSKAPDKKPTRIIEEIIGKYAVDANLFRLGSTNSKKEYLAPDFFWPLYRVLFVGGLMSG